MKGREEIQKIIVRLPESQSRTINDRHMPDINCQYLLAVAMLDGKIVFHNSHDFERMHDPQVLELKKRVEIVADAELTRIHPAVRAGIVEIVTFDGRQFKLLIDRTPGAPYNPLSPAGSKKSSCRSACRFSDRTNQPRWRRGLAISNSSPI